MTRGRTIGGKYPVFRLRAAAARKSSKTRGLIGSKASPFGRLTVGHENHAIFPTEILDAHAVELPFDFSFLCRASR
jgi:hypothetical protein